MRTRSTLVPSTRATTFGIPGEDIVTRSQPSLAGVSSRAAEVTTRHDLPGRPLPLRFPGWPSARDGQHRRDEGAYLVIDVRVQVIRDSQNALRMREVAGKEPGGVSHSLRDLLAGHAGQEPEPLGMVRHIIR